MTGGIVFRAGEELAFLPATIAIKVMPLPEVARVPGAPEAILGVTLVDGGTMPVVCAAVPWSRPRSGAIPMLVLAFSGERIGLVGIDVLATGHFEATAEGVMHEGNPARPFDVAALVARFAGGRWAV